MRLKTLPKTHREIATSYNNMTDVCNKLGKYCNAFSFLDIAAICDKLPDWAIKMAIALTQNNSIISKIFLLDHWKNLMKCIFWCLISSSFFLSLKWSVLITVDTSLGFLHWNFNNKFIRLFLQIIVSRIDIFLLDEKRAFPCWHSLLKESLIESSTSSMTSLYN